MTTAKIIVLLLAAGCSQTPTSTATGRAPTDEAALRPPSAPILTDCGPCGGFWDWGHRLAVCPSPSEGLFQAEYDCLCAGAGAVACAAWCASYAACAAGSDPLCTIPDDPPCDAAMSVGGACHAEAFACGADHTGCVGCPAWLEGGDPQWLCPMTGGPPGSIEPAIDLSDCACAGGCSAKCSAACPGGLFNPGGASFGCGTCLAGGACAALYSTCNAN